MVCEPGTRADGGSLEGHIWIVHRLCLREPILWDGDAYLTRALWHQPDTDNTEGPRCFVGPMNDPGNLSCMIFIVINGMHFVKVDACKMSDNYDSYLCNYCGRKLGCSKHLFLLFWLQNSFKKISFDKIELNSFTL